MNAAEIDDEIDFREDSNLTYSSNSVVELLGKSVLGKPITDFNYGTYPSKISPYFSDEPIQIRIHREIIPEPKEYAIAFGLFALGFVFFHRRQQKKKEK